ncbi:hypothetical protein ABZ682_18810 [Streptomyces griseoviridis]|uniref:hypothetical protein n=1 Tax=Streptomyces griseoviridis TaxID=45398 RepID=UPI0034083048
MYLIRPATCEDRESAAGLIAARDTWLRNRSLRSYGNGPGLLDLLAQPREAASVIGLFDGCDGRLLGCCALLSPSGDLPGWTAAECAERSWLMGMAHTHPDVRGSRLGWLMTVWASDYAARQPHPPTWIRCAVGRPLIAYCRDSLAWETVRAQRMPDIGTGALMQRLPEKKPALAALIDSRMPKQARLLTSLPARTDCAHV